MNTQNQTKQKNLLPMLRNDLELSIAPEEEGGKPVWMLHDPVHATFTRIDWIQFEIIKRLDRPQTFEELISRLNRETTIREDNEEILAFLEDLIKHGLTTKTLHKNSDSLEAEMNLRKTSPLKWLIFHYLYFRVPILHPDQFLEKTIGVFRLLSSKIFFILYIALSLIGLYFLSQRFDEYIHTFTNFLNPRGIFIYGVSIALLKTLHEFSHAYTAKHYGNRVPTMGLAFIILWPIPFCDVTDSWRMSSRRKRLRISAAGIIAELTIAGIALFIWGISSNSPVKSITFVLSSLSLLSTLLVNLNPLMRFDGYYIFSDLSGIDNLQPRAFSMTRWFYRKFLLGLKLDCPEPQLSLKRKFFMILYSICTWIYRFFLYTGIAVVVYYTFPKIIGIFMFAVEIVIFLIKPLYSELTTDYKLIRGRKISIRFALFIIALSCILIWLALPFSRYSSIPAITIADEMQIIYSPASGTIASMDVTRSQIVKQEEKLITIDISELNSELKLAELTVIQLANDLRQINSKPELKALAPQLRETYLQAKARLRALNEEIRQSDIHADISGTVTDLKDTLTDGVAVYKGEELGRVYNMESISLRVYATARQAGTLRTGDEVNFIPSYTNIRNTEYKAVITHIRPTREEYLLHPALSSTHGGSLEVLPDRNNRLKLIRPYFEIECSFTGTPPNLRFDQPGRITFWSRPRSYLKDLAEHIWQILIRESGI